MRCISRPYQYTMVRLMLCSSLGGHDGPNGNICSQSSSNGALAAKGIWPTGANLNPTITPTTFVV